MSGASGMRLTSFGAAGGEVTGSCHLVEAAGHRILLDCGMFQGGRDAEARNAAPFGFDPATIDAVVLSHAHIDHCGRLPLLLKRGFVGPVFAQRATCQLLPILLTDAAFLSARSAERANRRQPERAARAEPLYTAAEVTATQRRLRVMAYDAVQDILPGVRVTLREAGHILGSASITLAAGGRTLVFSGDVGMRGMPILRDPVAPPDADLVLMESTYGDRNHRDRAATVAELGAILAAARASGGNVVLPAFAVGRSQELLYWFARHWHDWDLAAWSIFLDSPMAAAVMDIYAAHEALFDAEARRLWRGPHPPFQLPNLHVTASVEESKAINRIKQGAIIIAGSGMANGGRVRHHLANLLGQARHHVVFVGYQAEGTLGRALVNRAPHVHLDGFDVPVRAQIHTVGGLSAHADQQMLLDWYGACPNRPPVLLAHGEDTARRALAAALAERFGTRVALAEAGVTREVRPRA